MPRAPQARLVQKQRLFPAKKARRNCGIPMELRLCGEAGHLDRLCGYDDALAAIEVTKPPLSSPQRLNASHGPNAD